MFSSSYSVIVRVRVLLKRTVVGDWCFDNLSGSHLQSQVKIDDNWVRNISSRPLDKTETHVLFYGLKHSVTPKRIPTESIVSSVEAVLSRQQDLSEAANNNIRSRIASTVQSASIPDNNLTKDEQQTLKWLKNDNIVILPADKGRVTVVMDKTDYCDKMDALVNDKQTYKELKRDPMPALQRNFNNKILMLKKTDAIDTQRYYRLRCSVPHHRNLTDYRNCTNLVYRWNL